MTPDPALLAALAAAPGIEPDPSQVGKVGVFVGVIVGTDGRAWLAKDKEGDTEPTWIRCVAIIDPPDPRDAEIARLRARVAELEAGR